MKDGFYLSTYVHIDEIAHLYDLRIRHDQNISLWHKSCEDVELVHYWELERLTGIKKNNNSMYSVEDAKCVINRLLSTYNLSLEDMVEVWGTPQLQTCEDYHPLESYPQLSYHSIGHLFSAIMSDTEKFYNEKIIGLAVDAGPDRVIDTAVHSKYYYSGCFVDKGKLHMFPIHSPAFLWRFAYKHYNLKEGTLMALATASTSEAHFPREEVVEIDRADSLHQAYEYVMRLVDIVDRLTAEDEGKLFNGFDPRFTIQENKISMVMKEIQKMSLRIVEKDINTVLEKYGIDSQDAYLSMSGGYALNCPTNSHLMEKYAFKGFIAPPCVSDTGMSMGYALYAFYKKMGFFRFKLKNSYYGNKDECIEKISENEAYRTFVKSITDIDLKQAVADLKEGPVIWFNGAAEVGPRALGHRSIIADPRSGKAKDRLNEVKQRQWWRPVAPIIAEEAVDEWFENAYPTPFMLHTFRVREDRLNLVPAIAHMDRTARVQTVNRMEEPLLYDLIKAFSEDTGVPIICNTSLNDIGEPIIDRIEEALNFALRKGIHVAYINGKRFELRNHEFYQPEHPHKRAISFMAYKDDQEKENLMRKNNPYNISRESLIFYYHRPDLFQKLSINKKEDARKYLLYARIANQKLGVGSVPGI